MTARDPIAELERDPLARPGFHPFQVLTSQALEDFATWANRSLWQAGRRHGWGVAAGLRLRRLQGREDQDDWLEVGPGEGVDPLGRSLYLGQPLRLPLRCTPGDDGLLNDFDLAILEEGDVAHRVVAELVEEDEDAAPYQGSTAARPARFVQRVAIRLRREKAPEADWWDTDEGVWLAQLLRHLGRATIPGHQKRTREERLEVLTRRLAKLPKPERILPLGRVVLRRSPGRILIAEVDHGSGRRLLAPWSLPAPSGRISLLPILDASVDDARQYLARQGLHCWEARGTRRVRRFEAVAPIGATVVLYTHAFDGKVARIVGATARESLVERFRALKALLALTIGFVLLFALVYWAVLDAWFGYRKVDLCQQLHITCTTPEAPQ